jgi:cell shape-determining protein MreD
MRVLTGLWSIVEMAMTVVTGAASSGGARLPITAFSVAAVQSLLINDIDGSLFRYLDLPLAVVIALSLTRPTTSVVTGFVFGLAVDSFNMKLFGLHGLAYCVLGPVASAVPVGSLRSRTEIVASLATVQCLLASTIVLGASWIADGVRPPSLFANVVQVTLWSVIIVLPLSAALGGRMGLATPEPSDRPTPATSAEWR